jgi:Fe-Mn family superoxide dismutase
MTRHVLPPLPYDYSALEPWIDALTVRIHHDHHHLKCIEGLNAAEERLAAAWQSGDLSLVPHFQRLVAVHEAEHFLHGLFWEIMGADQGGQPRDQLADQVVEDFGSFAAFKSRFSAAATNLEAGGWVVLVWQLGSQQLAIRTLGRHRQLWGWGSIALLALDVWEHAYYLKYEDRRGEYVHNWWNTVNWTRVGFRFAGATSSRSSIGSSRVTRRADSRRRDRGARLPSVFAVADVDAGSASGHLGMSGQDGEPG